MPSISVQEVKGWASSASSRCSRPARASSTRAAPRLPTAVGTMHGSYQMVGRGRQGVRRADSVVHAVGAAHAALTGASTGTSAAHSPAAGASGGGPDASDGAASVPWSTRRSPTASVSATSASSKIQPIVRFLFPVLLPPSSLVAVLRLAGCVTAAAAAPPAPPPPTVAPAPPAAAAAACSTQPVPGARCPAGATTASTRPGPRSAPAARRWHNASRRPRAVAGAVRRRGGHRRPQNAAVRAFFESHFIPYRVRAADGTRHRARSPATTSRCSSAAARRPRRFAVPLYAAARRPADDRPRRAATPSSRTGECAAASTASASSRTGRAPTSRRGAAPVADKVLVWVDRPGRGVLPADPGFGAHRADRRQRDARGLRRPERPSVPLHRPRADRPRRTHARAGVDAGHPGVGPAQSGQAARAAGREPELRVLPRGAGPGAGYARGGDRRPDRHARRAAAARTHDGGRPPQHSAGRAGVPRRRPTRCRAGRCERLVLAQDTGGAIGGAVRGDFFWGFGDEAGRQAGRMQQEGRMLLLWPKGAPLPGSPG